jgi:hypothetical protein
MHRRVARAPLVAALLAKGIKRRACGSDGSWCLGRHCAIGNNRGRRRCNRFAMTADRGTEGIAEIAQEMPAVGNLDSGRRPVSDGAAEDAGAITRNDLHTRMLFEPGRDSRGVAVRQQVDDLLALQVAQNGAVGQATPLRIFIYADNARLGRRRQLRSANKAKQRRTADRHAEAISKAGACRTTQRQAKMALDVSEALTAACPGTDSLRQALGKDPTWTVAVGAAESACLYPNSGDAALARQVSQRAGVVAVHVIRKNATARAGSLRRCGLGYDGHAIRGRQNLYDRQACRNER